MTKIPCIDCITLSICKAIKSKYPKDYMDSLVVTILESRCELLAEFTRRRYEPGCEDDPTIPVIEFFRGVYNG